MADHFGRIYEGLLAATDAMQQANTATGEAIAALTRTVQAAHEAHVEQEDLRESVARLEALVLDLQRRLPPTDARGSY